jgi:hypothetical protein
MGGNEGLTQKSNIKSQKHPSAWFGRTHHKRSGQADKMLKMGYLMIDS